MTAIIALVTASSSEFGMLQLKLRLPGWSIDVFDPETEFEEIELLLKI
jgi:hypothetical protein